MIEPAEREGEREGWRERGMEGGREGGRDGGREGRIGRASPGIFPRVRMRV